MLDRGRVFKVEKNIAWVEFAASSGCAQCGACHKATSGNMIFEAENPVGGRVGDTVEVEIATAVKVVLPLIIFGFPIVSLFLGLIIGSFISEKMGIILGIVFLVLGFLSLKVFDRYIPRVKKFRGRIVRIL